MPQPHRERPGRLAAVPDDITDPLLWRLAIDVLAAHQPGHDGNCRNLQCAGQTGICAAASHARRALTVARTATRPANPAPREAAPRPPAPRSVNFIGWFTTPKPATTTELPDSGSPRRPITSLRHAA